MPKFAICTISGGGGKTGVMGGPMRSYQVLDHSISTLKPYARNARVHSKKQIRQIADSIERFGFTNPVLVSDGGEIIAGHGRVEAARLLGRKTVPTIALSHLSDAERRAYVLAGHHPQALR